MGRGSGWVEWNGVSGWQRKGREGGKRDAACLVGPIASCPMQAKTAMLIHSNWPGFAACCSDQRPCQPRGSEAGGGAHRPAAGVCLEGARVCACGNVLILLLSIYPPTHPPTHHLLD